LKKIKIIPVFLLMVSLAGFLNSLNIWEKKSREEWENYLKTSEVVRIQKELDMGRTDFWKIALYDGSLEKTAIFKYIDRSRPHLIPDSYKYEIAAYTLDKLLNLNMVPPVVRRDIEGHSGSLQLFLTQDEVFSESERMRKNISPLDPEVFKNDLLNMNVFEILTYLDPRQKDDVKIDIKSWHVYRVDFSEAFAPVPSLLKDREISGCSKDLYNHMKNLDIEELHKKLDEYLNEEELPALITRLNLIIEEIDKLIEKKGEKSVLFEK